MFAFAVLCSECDINTIKEFHPAIFLRRVDLAGTTLSVVQHY